MQSSDCCKMEKAETNRHRRSLRKISVIACLAAIVILCTCLSVAGALTFRVHTTTEITSINGQNPDMFPVALRPGDTVTVMGVVTAEWDPLPPFHIAPQGDITIKYRLQGTSGWVSATTTTTDDSGIFTASFDAPSDPGVYDLRAVFDGEKWVGRWCLWSFEWKDSRVTVVGAFVIPEYTMAALGAMLSSFGAFVVYKYRDRFHR